jgi:hypothetical protein
MKGFRTLLINIVPLFLTLTDYLVNNGAFVSAIVKNPERAVVVIGMINVLNIILRFMTTTPVGKKE